eukprot:TRINITY_DN5639_c2_g1_i1.p1 TRINITY_DN5639_c2_g1~~TRINITY_DN5639_c2_g1_i1.p1  ORF type:complete len:399 (-),score=112.61 TRINITY_DN5639_c2_g1_i1:50-1246(-)
MAAAAEKTEEAADAPSKTEGDDPRKSFDAAREAASKLHEVLNKLKDGKASAASSQDFVSSVAKEFQHQLLSLRRAHRAMVKLSEIGRADEAAARKAADAEYAHLETRQYESACCRAAARRCRALPTPQLNELRNFLEGFEEEEEDEEVDGATKKGNLAAQLEVERLERSRLAEELDGLEQKRKKELDAFRERERLGADLSAKLGVVDRALEPVCNLLALRPQPLSAEKGADGTIVAKLPAPLRLIYSKFNVFVKQGGVAVSIEDVSSDQATPPPEKRRRLEAADSGQLVVFVEIKAGDKLLAKLRFANPSQCLVTVAVEGSSDDSLLDNLWPEDDGRNSALLSLIPGAEAAKGGRPYGWAQILAGLREEALAAVPNLFSMEGVTVNEVVSRVRNKQKA